MEEIEEQKTENKVLIGFKCSPSLRNSLCNQADKLGVSLSSYVETLVLSQDENNKELKTLSEKVSSLREEISFYENPFLHELFEAHKGKEINYKNSSGKTITLNINSIKDVFTVIINSFKKTK
jgi:hypothetical protein